MSDNRENEVKDIERITGAVYMGSGDINVGGHANEVPAEKKFSVEYLRYLADLSYAQEEYEKAIDLYREAEELVIRKNPILASFIQASIANSYAKLHEFDFSAQYYLRARYSMVGELQRNTESPPVQKSDTLTRSSILAFIIGAFLFLVPTVYLSYIGFITADISALPAPMLGVLVIAMIGYFLIFINLASNRAKRRNRREL